MQLASEELVPNQVLTSGHPMDSSRVLLELMRLSRRADQSDGQPGDPLGGIISRGSLRALLSAMHFRDPETMQHSRRVAQLATGMAEYLGWEGRPIRMLEIAALLHDFGKVGVPDNVLKKPGKLSHEESELISVHHNIVIDILQACRVDKEVLDVLGQCYDLYNGSNIGERRVGSNVHQGARILAVADAYDAIARDQSHRRGRPHQEVVAELKQGAGTQFDGNVVAALERWIDSDGLPFDDVDSEGEYIEPPSPVQTTEDALEAHALCHIFSYLYMLESLYDGFYVVDADLKCMVWSRGAEKLLGRSGGSMLGQAWTSKLLNYADGNRPLPDAECPLRQVVESGRPNCRVVKLQCEDSTWVDVEVQAFPLTDGEGRLLGVAEIFRDANRAGRKPREYRELKLAASRDALTQLANRGELETQLTVLVGDWEAGGERDPFSVIFLDVDYFKAVNDNHGHAVGDQVLIDVARMMTEEVYSGELVARYGGEEFVIACPSTDLDQAVLRAERLRVALSKADVGGATRLRCTASFGVAQVEQGDSVESLLRRADKALYTAKETGRNRTISLTPEQLQNGSTIDRPTDPDAENPFVRVTSFAAIVASDMVVYKLAGFVDAMQADLVKVTKERTVIRLGRKGLLPFWGRHDDRQPVTLTVELQDLASAQRANRGGSSLEVKARVTPVGCVRNSEVFQARARRVLTALKSHFVVNQ